jgi:glycosyltransferase involved in cell wall biosynthesis
MDNSLAPKISAMVMIYNEEAQIRQCLDTVKWVDEIVVGDSFSTDRTVEICREFTDKIYQRKFDNFGNQKKWLQEKPAHEWVLFVEGDERFPDELGKEIRRRLAANEGFDGYWITFKNFVFGRPMKGNFWDFKKIKLYKKSSAVWEDKFVHAGFILNGKAGELDNPVLHYPYPNLRVLFDKFKRYTTLEAKQLIYIKKPIGWVDTLKAACGIPLRFYKFFVELEHYKCGFPGLVVAFITSFYTITINIRYWNFKICGNSH